MLREKNYKAALDTWGPIRITIDKRAKELWSEVPYDSIRDSIIKYRRIRERLKGTSFQLKPDG